MRMKTCALFFTTLSLCSPFLQAAQWQVVASQPGEHIELDLSRIARVGASESLAWSRLRLESQRASARRLDYTSVEALNRYDCDTQRFTTVKRVYLQGMHPLREEVVRSPRSLAIHAGSVDARLLALVCPQLTPQPQQHLAASPAAEDIARPMHADLLQAAESQGANLHAVQLDMPARSNASGRMQLPKREDLAAQAAAQVTQAATPPGNDQPVSPATAKPRTPAAPAANTATAASTPGSSAVSAKPDIGSIAAAAAAAAAASSPGAAKTAPRTFSIPRPQLRKTTPPPSPPPSMPAPVVSKPTIPWSYEGAGGPVNWGKLQPEYALCATGKRQSPIDIRDSILVDLEPLKLNFRPALFRIIDNGHTVKASFALGAGTLEVMGRHFDLQELHFHRPAEERINGQVHDLGAHLVFQDLEGRQAIIAILFDRGSEHPLIQTLWNNLPLERQQELAPSIALDLNQLLPAKRDYWTYMGSRTMPPCSEDVLWMVFKQAQQISDDQISIFSRLYRQNARPLQPTNNRLIKGSR